MNKATREQLEAKLCEAEMQVKVLNKEMEKMRQTQKAFDQGYEMGTQIAALKAGMVEGGLSSDFAMDIIMASLQMHM